MLRRLNVILVVSVVLAACGDDDTAQNNNNNENVNTGDCGDGVVDLGEQCDEGSANSDSEPDACRTDCRDAYCGDGVLDTGEVCDDADDNDDDAPDTCRTTCLEAHCGDGTVDTGEACDDGNTSDGDGCSADCSTTESCGNGIVDTGFGETCDCGIDPGNLPQGCYVTNDNVNTYCLDACTDLCAWSQKFGDVSAGDALGVDVDASGNIVITGKFVDYIDLGGGPLGQGLSSPRAYVAKFDADGNHLWSVWFRNQQMPSNGESEGRDVRFDSQGDIYAMGVFGGVMTLGSDEVDALGMVSTYVVKLDGGSGAVLIQRQIGYGGGMIGYDADGERQGLSLAIDDNDNVVVVGLFTLSWGCFSPPCTYVAIGEDPFVVKYDSALVTQWTLRSVDSGDDRAIAAAFDASGNLFFTGQLQNSISFGAPANLFALDPTYLFGYVIKVSPTGTPLWGKMLGTAGVAGEHTASGIAVLSTGDLAVAGTFRGSLTLSGTQNENSTAWNAFMVAYANDGSYLWHRRAGTDWAWTIAVARDTNDNLAFSGAFDGTIDLGGGSHLESASQTAFVARYDDQGTYLGSKSFGLAVTSVPWRIATQPAGDVILVGASAGDIDFGCGPHGHTAVGSAPFVTRLHPF